MAEATTSEKMTDAPTCWICGKPALVAPHDDGDGSYWVVDCDNAKCGNFAAGCGSTREEAIAAWNTRAAPDRPERDG